MTTDTKTRTRRNQLQTSALTALELDDQQRRFLRAIDIRTADDLLAAMWSFPLHEHGFDTAALSSVLLQRASQGFALRRNARAATGRPVFRAGAKAPAGNQFTLGAAAKSPAALVKRASKSALLGVSAATGRRGNALAGDEPSSESERAAMVKLVRGGVWPVKDQGERGTCVAFALAACAERRRPHDDDATALSEQFLYWAVKTHTADPVPGEDGAFLEHGLDALKSHGICTADHWPYDPVLDESNISHGQAGRPSPSALADAAARRLDGKTGRDTLRKIRGHLDEDRPVAISLPVFVNPHNVDMDNWNTDVALDYGKVLNPFPGTVVDGGHAVCVVGYVIDEEEPNGGYFLFRNSWGSEWGGRNPAEESYAPALGYGQVSATYVRNYLWEGAALV